MLQQIIRILTQEMELFKLCVELFELYQKKEKKNTKCKKYFALNLTYIIS